MWGTLGSHGLGLGPAPAHASAFRGLIWPLALPTTQRFPRFPSTSLPRTHCRSMHLQCRRMSRQPRTKALPLFPTRNPNVCSSAAPASGPSPELIISRDT